MGHKSAGGYLRRELGKSIKLRYIPEIIFKFDDSLERGMYMEKLINSVNKKSSDKEEVEDDDK